MFSPEIGRSPPDVLKAVIRDSSTQFAVPVEPSIRIGKSIHVQLTKSSYALILTRKLKISRFVTPRTSLNRLKYT